MAAGAVLAAVDFRHWYGGIDRLASARVAAADQRLRDLIVVRPTSEACAKRIETIAGIGVPNRSRSLRMEN
jgi:hypothetical protein